jgi:metallo-beta-lactamase family protein
MKVTFYGAAQRVTGSKHLLTTESGKNILLDCGMFQGIGTTELNLSFGFNVEEIDVLVLSHAHIDHTGLVPRLVKKGFRGEIYCTPATYSLCSIMLLDSARIQERDLERVNKRRTKRGEKALELLYDENDVNLALSLFKTIPYHQKFTVVEGLIAEYFDTGHILGSAGVYFEFQENNVPKSLFFTGDIGRPNDKILRSPEAFPQANTIICESTYGNRLHDAEVDMKSNLLDVIRKTCVEKKGKVIIPAFAIDRTQELIYALDQLEREGLLPVIPVYIDSPLAVKATLLMNKHKNDFNQTILKYIEKDGDAFGFHNLNYITEVEDSKALNDSSEACIIISASGMAEAGRIKHHIANSIENPNNTVLIVGYCSQGSLGYELKTGEPEVKIFGETKKVNAKIVVMDSFSAHADYKEIIEYLACQDSSLVSNLFLVHGELDVQTEFKEKLNDVGFKNVFIPSFGQSFSV